MAYSPIRPKSQISNVGHDSTLSIRNFILMMNKLKNPDFEPLSSISNVGHDGTLSIRNFILMLKELKNPRTGFLLCSSSSWNDEIQCFYIYCEDEKTQESWIWARAPKKCAPCFRGTRNFLFISPTLNFLKASFPGPALSRNLSFTCPEPLKSCPADIGPGPKADFSVFLHKKPSKKRFLLVRDHGSTIFQTNWFINFHKCRIFDLTDHSIGLVFEVKQTMILKLFQKFGFLFRKDTIHYSGTT
jgi:hypothetical protein